VVAAFLLLPDSQPAAGQTISDFGRAQINGPLQVEITLSPAIATPGDRVQLQVTLINHTQANLLPELSFQLPAGVAVDRTQLPAGMTANLPDNRLDWQPLVSANGGSLQFNLPLYTESADISVPGKRIVTILQNPTGVIEVEALLWVGIRPHINQIWHPPQVAVGQPFQLRGELSGSGPFTQMWHLGDGRRVEVDNPTVVYSAPGLYEVELAAGNPLGTVLRKTTITVVPHPAAQFAPDDTTPGVGQPISFINQSGGERPLNYLWDLGDGTLSTEMAPEHQYAAPGLYQVHLTVSNSYGQSEAFWQVQVGQPPVADMNVPPQMPAGAPLLGQGFGDDTVTQYEWNMGDGRILMGEFIEHTYLNSGEYYVTLTASNEFGGVQIGRWVEITPGTLSIFLPFLTNFSALLAGDGVQTAADELNLPAVELDEPFIMAPLVVPPGSSSAEQLYLYINEARRQFDLPALSFKPELTSAAQQHTNEMAAYGYTAHTGADGSTPAERLQLFNYRGGYAGEATAWGFQHPQQAVEFWINSAAHRRIILNEAATELGVGYSVDIGSANVWYWTAEFGNEFGSASQPVLRIRQPQTELSALVTRGVTFSWNWPRPLSDGQKFVLYLHTSRGNYAVAEVRQPTLGTRYDVQLTAVDMVSSGAALQVQPGAYSWHVALEGDGVLLAGESRTIVYEPDPNLPTPTPTPILTVAPPTVTPAIPTATPSPTATIPVIGTPLPPLPTSPPPLPTATPNP
jgi:uncharacterized protein YkwD/PKD repeat protein